MSVFCKTRIVLAAASALLSLALVSCQDSGGGNGGGNGDTQFKKNTYYSVQDKEHGWEEGMYYNGMFIMAHADSARGTTLYYLNDTKSESREGILLEFDEDGEVVTVGHPGNIASVCEKNGKLCLCKGDGNGGLTFAEVDAGATQGKAVVPGTDGRKAAKGIIGDIGKTLVEKFVEYLDDKAEKKWGTKVFGPLKNAFDFINKTDKLAKDEKWVQIAANTFAVGVSAASPGGAAAGIVTGVNLMVDEYNELVELQHHAYYGYSTPVITNVTERSDGAYNVTVRLDEAQTIPVTHYENIISADGSERRVAVKNVVYCGVLSRDDGTPLYNHCDTRSGETLVKTYGKGNGKGEGNGSDEYTFVIYADAEKGTNIRPFLMADLDLTNKPNMKRTRDYIKYGDTRLLVKADVDYSYEVEYASADASWNSTLERYDKSVGYSVKFTAKCNGNVNSKATRILDWGVALLKDGKVRNEMSLMKEQDDQAGIGTMTSVSTQYLIFDEDELEIMPSSYRAVPKGCETVPYIVYSGDFFMTTRYTSYGVAKPFRPLYIQKPSAEYVGTEYFRTFRTGTESSVKYYDKFSGGYIDTTVDWEISVNSASVKINGALFVDSVKNVFTGWDKYASIMGKSGDCWSNFCDGTMNLDYNLYYREDSASENSNRHIKVALYSKGSSVKSSNSVWFKGLKMDNYGANIYHFYGFKAEIK